MQSNGSLNGPVLGGYPMNGGGFIGEVSGSVSVEIEHQARPTVRRMASAVTVTALRGRIVTGVTGMTTLAVKVSGAMKVRKVTGGKSTAAFSVSGKALRRPIASAVFTAAFLHLGKAGYLYFRPTDRRRISSIVESRSTLIGSEYRAVQIQRDHRVIVIPREAGK